MAGEIYNLHLVHLSTDHMAMLSGVRHAEDAPRGVDYSCSRRRRARKDVSRGRGMRL